MTHGSCTATHIPGRMFSYSLGVKDVELPKDATSLCQWEEDEDVRLIQIHPRLMHVYCVVLLLFWTQYLDNREW